MAVRVRFRLYMMISISDVAVKMRLKALGAMTEKRYPDVPGALTMAESGFPGFEQYTQGLGVVAPAGTPPAVINKLNEVIRASLAKPETKEKLKGLGAVTEGGSTPEEFRKWLVGDRERWARVIKAAGVKAE